MDHVPIWQLVWWGCIVAAVAAGVIASGRRDQTPRR
jgi:hypothetical protein